MNQSDTQELINLLCGTCGIWFMVEWIANFYYKVRKQVRETGIRRNTMLAEMANRSKRDAERLEKETHASCYNGYRSAPPK